MVRRNSRAGKPSALSGNKARSTDDTAAAANPSPLKGTVEIDPQALVAAAPVEVVPLNHIDLLDHRYQHRDATCPPCNPDDLIVVDDVLDGAAGVDPIILRDRGDGKKLQIVSGFGRLDVAPENTSIKKIRCNVLRDVPDAAAVIVAARANLTHGQMLTTNEKRRCFRMEMEAIEAGGYMRPNNSALHRAYGVSRNTVKRWRESLDCESKNAGTTAGRGGRTANAGVARKRNPSKGGGKASGADEKRTAAGAQDGEETASSQGEGDATSDFEHALDGLCTAIDVFFEIVRGIAVPDHCRTQLLRQADRIRDFVHGLAANRKDVA